jgi:hypothetical protein
MMDGFLLALGCYYIRTGIQEKEKHPRIMLGNAIPIN